MALVIGCNINADFNLDPEREWLNQAINSFGEEAMIYKDSKNLSHSYRFQVWLLHLEGYVKVKMMEWRFDSHDDVIKVKKFYHDQVMSLMSKIKEADKMN